MEAGATDRCSGFSAFASLPVDSTSAEPIHTATHRYTPQYAASSADAQLAKPQFPRGYGRHAMSACANRVLHLFTPRLYFGLSIASHLH